MTANLISTVSEWHHVTLMVTIPYFNVLLLFDRICSSVQHWKWI